MTSSAARHGSLAIVLCIAACLLSLSVGQDSSYDLWNYHLYNGWSLVTGRWSQDLFAAGGQTFFAPWLDVPYYLAAKLLLPSHPALLVALAGLPYGIVLCLLCLLANTLAQSLGLAPRERVAFVVVAVSLSATGAGAWSLIGTTMNDLHVAILVLAALYVYLRDVVSRAADPSLRTIATAGLLLGLAMGLKLTAAIYVPTMALVVVVLASNWRNRMLGLFVFGVASTLAVVAVYGPWAYKLHATTGNPFFPMFNGVFQSDWIAPVNLRDERFLPKSPADWFFYPFYWATTNTTITEVPFRDLRFAFAQVVVLALVVAAVIGRGLRAALPTGALRAVWVLAIFGAASYVVWLNQFAILRYLVPTECVAGLLIATALALPFRTTKGETRRIHPALVALFVAATIAYTVSPDWRRAPVDANILAAETQAFPPGALVLFADQPMSFLAPGIEAKSPGARFMTLPRNFTTEPRLTAGAPTHGLGQRMKAKVAEHDGPRYVLFNVASGPPAPADLAYFGLTLAMERCQPGHSPMGLEFIACPATHRPAT